MILDNAEQITRATRALVTYEQSAFPGEPSLLQHDPLYAEALLTALLCDLEHYANQHGINFSNAISTGRSIHAEETADQTVYEVGDQVRLTRQSGRCGTIIGWTTLAPDAQPDFLVGVPGVPFVYAEAAAQLTPAPPFPPTETSLGTVTHADQAEQTYASITARLLSTAAPACGTLDQDRHRLLDALSSWSGIPTTQLRNALTPARRATSSSTSPPQGPKAAAADTSSNLGKARNPSPPSAMNSAPQA